MNLLDDIDIANIKKKEKFDIELREKINSYRIQQLSLLSEEERVEYNKWVCSYNKQTTLLREYLGVRESGTILALGLVFLIPAVLGLTWQTTSLFKCGAFALVGLAITITGLTGWSKAKKIEKNLKKYEIIS